MKKLLTVFLLMVSTSAFAQHHHGHHHGGYGFRPYSWIGPTIIGGVIGYEIARQQPIIIQQPTIVQQQPAIIQQSPQVCTDWKEIQQPDGKIYRERTCSQ